MLRRGFALYLMQPDAVLNVLLQQDANTLSQKDRRLNYARKS